MKERHIGYMVYFGRPIFTLVRRITRKHWLIVPKDWNVYKHVMGTHFKGITRKGEKFVYCPVSLLVSWSAGDYDHEWCHACQKFFSEHVADLLDADEKERLALP